MTEAERSMIDYILDPDKGGRTQEELDAALAAGDTLEHVYGACTAREFFPPQQTAPAAAWPQLIPFDEVELPSFPADVLPWPLDAVVEQLSASVEVDPSMVGVLALGFVAGLFQGGYKLHVRGDFYTELSLYCCAIAAPGERKTSVVEWLSAPVKSYEAERQQAEAAEVEANRQEREILEGRQKELKTRIIKGNRNKPSAARGKVVSMAAAIGEIDPRDELEAVNRELAEFTDKHPFEVLTDDCTNEALIDLLDRHGAMLMASDECGVFTCLKGRYDVNASIDVYLKGIDGSSIKVARLTRPGNVVPHPHLSLAVGAQPDAVREFVRNPTFSGRGLVQRFLYADCRRMAGYRTNNGPPVGLDTALAWDELVRKALDTNPDEPITLHFTDEAQAEAARFADEAEKALRDDGRLDFDLGWGSKFAGYVYRLSALFHLCAALSGGQDPASPVGVGWLEAAESVGWCLAEHTKHIFTEAGADPDTEDAKYILRRLQAKGTQAISERNLQKLCKRFHKMEELYTPLTMLEERGYIRRERVQTGGRPTERILVNPAALQ